MPIVPLCYSLRQAVFDGHLVSFRGSEHELFFRLDPEALFFKSGSGIHRRHSAMRPSKESKSARVRREA